MSSIGNSQLNLNVSNSLQSNGILSVFCTEAIVSEQRVILAEDKCHPAGAAVWASLAIYTVGRSLHAAHGYLMIALSIQWLEFEVSLWMLPSDTSRRLKGHRLGPSMRTRCLRDCYLHQAVLKSIALIEALAKSIQMLHGWIPDSSSVYNQI